ncbi:MAG: hypothetical protein JXB49_29765 [Bacteroidales bacterium]|nr:hypothetical protein [Bacteroidales bacterium]
MAEEFKIRYDGNNYRCLIHLDRLSITFRHWSGSSFQDIRNPDFIVNEQVYGKITLQHDASTGLGGFYHSYKVLYDGIHVGRLHAATKLKKHQLQLDFAKEVFYTFHSDFWYEVYTAVKNELGIIYNNIMYMEISIDTDKDLVEEYAFYFQNTIDNKQGNGSQYKLRGKTRVHVLDNGSSFVIDGTDCAISIYDKSIHAEKYIMDYFLKNGLGDQKVYRIESRLKWDYIRYLRNRKSLDITVETLKDTRLLAKIFQLSTASKTSFLDLKDKVYDENRNAHYRRINILDDLPLETADIGNLNKEIRNTHYISESIDENIIRQNYYRFLETGKKEYFQNFRSSCSVAGYNLNQVLNYISRFNHSYKGNRTQEVLERMQYVNRWFHGRDLRRFKDGLRNMANKMRALLVGAV